jgi:hypothetical protein
MDKQLLENVQIKAVNWVTGLNAVTYEEKCKELGLNTLEVRRWEQDMVQTYKILNGIGKIRADRFFTKIGSRLVARTRMAAGHDNLVLPRARTEVRRNSFSVRIVQSWNGLPDSIKSAGSLLAFKTGIKNYLESGGRPGHE